ESKDIISLELRNFHDLTISIIEFEPDIILYIPIEVIFDPDNDQLDINEIIHVELVEHLLETAQVVNSKVCYLNLKNKNIQNINKSLNLINGYPRSSIINLNQSEIDYNLLLREIFQ
ncbi:MAG: hypothetical protein ACC656_13955, partial [Candidatus Heimdallarchaeota archaeon]